MQARKYSNPKIKERLENINPVRREIIHTKMRIAAKIDDFMALRNWTKEDLAAKMNIPVSKVVLYLSGLRNYNIEELAEIAIALDVRIEDLI